MSGDDARDERRRRAEAGPERAAPRLTVVVPSHQRAHSLARVLEALGRQDAPRGSFEVVVVLDGSTDGSTALLEAWVRDDRLPGLRWHWQENAGQSAARDTGVRLAASPVVLFLDDDVVASPGLVSRHLAWHAAGERIAVLGDCEIVLDGEPPHTPPSLYMQFVRVWWEDTYRVRALPGRLPTYRDFCAGNVSVRRDDYLAVGGFDPSFRGYGGEDYELGYRLLAAGVRLVPDRGAHADHYHRQTVRSALRGARQEGIADVYLGRKHPELRAGLRLMHVPTEGSAGWMVRLALGAPRLDRAIMRLGAAALDAAEWLRLRPLWSTLHLRFRAHAYWSGVRSALGSPAALAEFQRGAELPRQTIEIARGLPPLAELRDFWVHGPSRLDVTLHGEPLATIELEDGPNEPLRGYLARWIVWRLPAAALLASADAHESPFDLGAAPAAGR